MPLGTIIGVVIAYVLIAVLLISLNLTSRWRWWIKGGAIVLTTIFFAGTYVAVSAMLGWPAFTGVPPRFSLLHTKIQEPDKFSDAPGQIFLWVEELDDNNIPMLRPRALELPYTDELAEKLREAQERLDNGESVMGEIQTQVGTGDGPQEQLEQDRADLQLQANQQQGEGQNTADTQPFLELDTLDFAFTELPPPIMPDKGPQ